jgi:hypothetical protein
MDPFVVENIVGRCESRHDSALHRCQIRSRTAIVAGGILQPSAPCHIPRRTWPAEDSHSHTLGSGSGGHPHIRDKTSSPRDSHPHSLGTACCLFTPLGAPGQGKRRLPNSQAAILCCVLVLRCTPSIYCAPAYTAGSSSAPLSRWNVDSATCKIFQITAVAFSTFLNRLAAVVVWRLGRATSLVYPIRRRFRPLA